MALRGERGLLLAVWALGACAFALGALAPASPDPQAGGGQQALDLIRVLTTACLALTLLLGPGVVWRARAGERRPGLGFLFLPGLALLAAVAGVAWALAPEVDPAVVSYAAFVPVMPALLAGLLGAGPDDVFEPEEHRALLIVGCALGLAIMRAVWSMGPAGELYGGTIARTLEVGDRSDPRISYSVVQLVAHGTKPFSDLGNYYFAPYDFSARGPLPGLASAPIVFLSGGEPPRALPASAWQPFDAQGFMAYRMAMMAMASTAFLALWDLTRRLGGTTAARFALLLAATTPFLVHEIWFAWPKMLAAAFVLLAAIAIVERRGFRSGLLMGGGYLMHPGALVWLSGISLVALWPLRGARLRRPQIGALALVLAGAAIGVLAWRLVNGDHYSQDNFLEYLQWAGDSYRASPGEWALYRLASLGNTLVPMLLPLAWGHSVSINVIGDRSPFAIHFFFQYWDTIPFGVGILFFPLLAVALWRSYRLWPWPVLATVVIPFLALWIYWGASKTGLLREGLQAWLLVVLAIVALQQSRAGFPWLASKPIRAILSLRAAEVLLVAVGPTLATAHRPVGTVFNASDVCALLGMIGFSAALAALVWWWSPDPTRSGEERERAPRV